MQRPLSELLYVSRSRVSPTQGAEAIADIVKVSVARNAGLGVTGALMWTGRAFAQTLEGDVAALDVLMTSINRDGRHHQVRVVQQGALDTRRFPGWALAYAGGASFVSGLIEPLLEDPSQPCDSAAVAKLSRAMRAFAEQAGSEPYG